VARDGLLDAMNVTMRGDGHSAIWLGGDVGSHGARGPLRFHVTQLQPSLSFRPRLRWEQIQRYLDRAQEVLITIEAGGWTKGAWHWRAAGITLTHLATGVKVSGEIPGALRGPKEMDRLGEKLIRDLEADLRHVVAKHRRLPRR
jgi:hypothetical protein